MVLPATRSLSLNFVVVFAVAFRLSSSHLALRFVRFFFSLTFHSQLLSRSLALVTRLILTALFLAPFFAVNAPDSHLLLHVLRPYSAPSFYRAAPSPFCAFSYSTATARPALFAVVCPPCVSLHDLSIFSSPFPHRVQFAIGLSETFFLPICFACHVTLY